MAKKKRPAFMFYVGDWLKDPCVSSCRPATRAIWMDLICGMHEMDESGILRGTVEQLARRCRCRDAEMRQALEELRATGTADIRVQDDVYVITNRRMHREYRARRKATTRVRNYRARAKRNGDVTLGRDSANLLLVNSYERATEMKRLGCPDVTPVSSSSVSDSTSASASDDLGCDASTASQALAMCLKELGITHEVGSPYHKQMLSFWQETGEEEARSAILEARARGCRTKGLLTYAEKIIATRRASTARHVDQHDRATANTRVVADRVRRLVEKGDVT